MATISVDSTQEIEAILHDEIRGLLEQKAYEVENTVKRLISAGGGSGRLYRTRLSRRGGKLYHRASAPGQPPSSDTGRLLGSVYHSIGEDGEGLYGRIGYGVKYGLYLELGTRRMAPRPALRPALYAATS